MWKHDLAKLKNSLKDEPPASRIPKIRKAPEPSPQNIEDEDALFRSAMGSGHRPSASPRVPQHHPLIEAPRMVPEVDATEAFATAMRDLKGLKKISETLPGESETKVGETPVLPASQACASIHAVLDVLPNQEPAEIQPDESLPPVAAPVPTRIQLAAGMVVDVDGSLDLQRHNVQDAQARLEERIQDALALGWRSMQLVLGKNPELHGMLLDFLKGESASAVMRYGQAPVPMGGKEAWILYFTSRNG